MDGVLVGNQSVFAERSALRVDVGNVRAFGAAHDLIEEAMLVSSRLAMSLTAKPAAEWSKVLTAQASADPRNSIEKVRFRSSKAEASGLDRRC